MPSSCRIDEATDFSQCEQVMPEIFNCNSCNAIHKFTEKRRISAEVVNLFGYKIFGWPSPLFPTRYLCRLKNSNLLHWIIFIALALTWGSSFILMKRGMDV